jgi:alpha-galactosidase
MKRAQQGLPRSSFSLVSLLIVFPAALLQGPFVVAAINGTDGLIGLQQGQSQLDLNSVREAPATVRPANPAASVANVKVVRDWEGSICRSQLVNKGKSPVGIKEVVLWTIPLGLPGKTGFYGEGAQMLSQTGGTVARPVDLGAYTDRVHYRLSQPQGATTVYGLVTLSAPLEDHVVLAFSGCRRFMGKFHLRPKSLEVVMDTEDLVLNPGESWELEEFFCAQGPARSLVLASLADRIAINHRPLRQAPVPTGWCSWYGFGPGVTAKQVLENADFISDNLPGLKYMQIDDGYQSAMGDWLTTGKAFNGDVAGVLKQIRTRGFEAALWVAPFVAEASSRLFKEHPDWFVHDEKGQPLRSDRVTFGGWRRGPWYALDGTHPEVQKHLEDLFRTLRREWGCTYFKLDATFWGMLPGARFHDAKATRVQAYRRGMEAIRKGAGDAFLLGCNHPIWPSFGLIHGSRSSSDIDRNWKTFSRAARENLNRNWQNGRLWWNDPDCLVLSGRLSEDEFRFHATALYASGGMLLSGDNLTRLPESRVAMLRKLLPPNGTAADFEDPGLRIGYVRLRDRINVCAFNWMDKPQGLSLKISDLADVRDFWTGEELGKRVSMVKLGMMPPHSARLVICIPVKKAAQP